GKLPKEPPQPPVKVSTPMAVTIQATQASTPVVSASDYSVPLIARVPSLLGPVPQIKNRQVLLAHLSMLLSAEPKDRIVVLETQYDLWHGYFQTADIDLADLMGSEDSLEDTARYYAHIRWRNASDPERLLYLVRSMEKYLEAVL